VVARPVKAEDDDEEDDEDDDEEDDEEDDEALVLGCTLSSTQTGHRHISGTSFKSVKPTHNPWNHI
jgi:hypothetical protein